MAIRYLEESLNEIIKKKYEDTLDLSKYREGDIALLYLDDGTAIEAELMVNEHKNSIQISILDFLENYNNLPFSWMASERDDL